MRKALRDGEEVSPEDVEALRDGAAWLGLANPESPRDLIPEMDAPGRWFADA